MRAEKQQWFQARLKWAVMEEGYGLIRRLALPGPINGSQHRFGSEPRRVFRF
jgi:hypothetical protein